MISNAFAECIDRMDDYFQRFPEVYAEFGPRLHRLREEMDEVRALLDAPPVVKPRKNAPPATINPECSAERLPDLIAWTHQGRLRVFPASQKGLAALMACPSFARYGVPLLHLGVDIRHTHLDSMAQSGLHIGCCEGDAVVDAVAAVAAWRALGRQHW